MSIILMRLLESAPSRYDRGIHLLRRVSMPMMHGSRYHRRDWEIAAMSTLPVELNNPEESRGCVTDKQLPCRLFCSY